MLLNPVSQAPQRRSPATLAASAAIHIAAAAVLYSVRFPLDAVRPRYNTTPLYLPAQPEPVAPLRPPAPRLSAPRLSARTLPTPPSRLTVPAQPELPAPPVVPSAPGATRHAPVLAPPVSAPPPTPASPPAFAAVAPPPAVAAPKLSAPAGFSAAPVPTISNAPHPSTSAAGFAAPGSAVASGTPAPVAATAGFGTAPAATRPARPSAAGTAGFGSASNGAAPPPARPSSGPAAFGAAVAAARPVNPATAAPTGEFSPLEILYKPRPTYTPEARDAKIEGEVVLEVLFAAAGNLKVLRVVRSLGYGLERSAIAAAGQIRFRPAREGKRAVDTVATVRIAFQLAY